MLLAAAAAAPGAKTATAADGMIRQGAVCKLHLEGFGDRPGLKQAQLLCTGGTITAAAGPGLLKALGSGTKGVVLSQSGDCDEGVKVYGCMLAVCRGSVATFASPVVTGIKGVTVQGGSALCITGGSSVALVNGTFANGSDMRPVRILEEGTTVLIKQCRFQSNTVVPSKRYGGAVMVMGTARVNILSSSFIDNSADSGGAIMVQGSAQVNVTSAQGPTSGDRRGTV